MDFKSVKSSNVDAIAHDAETNTLHVRFKGGGAVYAYQGVDAAKHAALLAADSVGGFLNSQIKGKHAHSKVGPE